MKQITITKGSVYKIRETETSAVREARVDRITVGSVRTIYFTLLDDGEQANVTGSTFLELMERADPGTLEEVNEIIL